MNNTVIGQSIVRNTASAASLRREQEDAQLRKLDSYSKYGGRITRVYVRHGLPETSGIGGYAGGILANDYDEMGNRVKRTYIARTFDANSVVRQESRGLKTKRAAFLWLAHVNGL